MISLNAIYAATTGFIIAALGIAVWGILSADPAAYLLEAWCCSIIYFLDRLARDAQKRR